MNIRKTKSQELAAAKAGISERSARRIDSAVALPSQNPRRYWRSRADPFIDVWDTEIRTDGGDTLITIGKQLSERLSVAYEKGLAAAGGTWQLLYRVAGRTTLRARAGVENAVDVIWSWRWD